MKETVHVRPFLMVTRKDSRVGRGFWRRPSVNSATRILVDEARANCAAVLAQ